MTNMVWVKVAPKWKPRNSKRNVEHVVADDCFVQESAAKDGELIWMCITIFKIIYLVKCEVCSHLLVLRN